jgi:hypothetical protein
LTTKYIELFTQFFQQEYIILFIFRTMSIMVKSTWNRIFPTEQLIVKNKYPNIIPIQINSIKCIFFNKFNTWISKFFSIFIIYCNIRKIFWPCLKRNISMHNSFIQIFTHPPTEIRVRKYGYFSFSLINWLKLPRNGWSHVSPGKTLSVSASLSPRSIRPSGPILANA